MIGTILHFKNDRGFGWLADESGTNHFFHISNVQGRKILTPGQAVVFDLIPASSPKHAGQMIAGNVVPVVEGVAKS